MSGALSKLQRLALSRSHQPVKDEQQHCELPCFEAIDPSGSKRLLTGSPNIQDAHTGETNTDIRTRT